MNQEQLYQRQQQIYRLHKKIRQYKLTPEQSIHLRRNQEQQELLIQSKFTSSKVNSKYQFPLLIDVQESPIIGYKDICDLNESNNLSDTIQRPSNSIKQSKQLETKRSIKSPQPRYLIELMNSSNKPDKSHVLTRESYSPRNIINKILNSNKTNDKRKQITKMSHYLSTSNQKSFNTLRMMTDSCQLKSTKNIRDQQLCQSIKSIVRVKNNNYIGDKKEQVKEKQNIMREYESLKPDTNKLNRTGKNTIANRGKQNETKPRYNQTKKANYYNYTNIANSTTYSNHNKNKIYTQHDKSVKQWGRSYFNTNTSKDKSINKSMNKSINKSITNMYSSVKSKQSLFTSSHKWLNTTNQDYKASIEKYHQPRQSMKRQGKHQALKNKYTSTSNLGYNYKSYKSSLNHTTNLKNKISEKGQSKNQTYFSKVFQNLRTKNSDGINTDMQYNASSRIPFSSPLSYKYLDYKQGLTLTNR